jgi:type IV pilus assembly protein PilE
MEHYYAENNYSYKGATLGQLAVNKKTARGFYTLGISNISATTYLLTATPLDAQAHDSICATLTLDQLGQKGETGSGAVSQCW